MRALLVPTSLLLAVAACAAPADDAPESPAIVDVDPKADTVSTVSLGALDLVVLRCELSSCSMALTLSGRVLHPEGASDLGGLAYGPLAGVTAYREAVRATVGPLSFPDGVTEAPIGASAIDAGDQIVELEIPRGETYALPYGLYDRWAGTISVQARVTLDADRGRPLPLAGTGAPWTEEHGDVWYWVDRPTPSAAELDSSGYAHDAWYVNVQDLFDFSLAPRVTIHRSSEYGGVSETIYWFCNADSTPSPSGPSMPVSTDSGRYESRAELSPSCPTWDESGRLYIEVDYRDVYVLSVEVR